MIPMKTNAPIVPGLLRFFGALIFLTMTMAFLTLPYALSRQPGESFTQLATAESCHLS
jgi:hypothetical protein